MYENIIFGLLDKSDICAMRDIVIAGLMEYIPERIEMFMTDNKNYVFGAKLNNQVVGLIYCYSLSDFASRKPLLFMYSVDVLPAYQDRGIGSKLVKYVVDYSKNNGFSETFVITDKGNKRACRVYEKAGGKSDFDDEIVYVMKNE